MTRAASCCLGALIALALSASQGYSEDGVTAGSTGAVQSAVRDARDAAMRERPSSLIPRGGSASSKQGKRVRREFARP